jgi:hypothetical protein
MEKDGDDELDRRVINEEEIQRVKEVRNIIHTINIRKANWICHILRRK